MTRSLALFLLFLYDFIFVINEASSSRLWHCPNISASKVIKGIWAENSRLGSMFLNIEPEPATGESNLERRECIEDLDQPLPWQQTTHQTFQEVYTLINTLSRNDICNCKKIKLPSRNSELKLFRGACNRRSRIYNQAALLRSCARLADTTVHQSRSCKGEIDFVEVKELLATIDYWSARSMMCVKCSESVVKRGHCGCDGDDEILY